MASPETTAEVSAVLSACGRLGVPVVPYGAGSGVCGGTLCTQGGVALDLKQLSRVRWMDARSRTVEVEAGHLGWTLEEKLARAGFTAGHFPSSISCSTVGGWVAARGAGQLSTRYGKIEDLCVGVEAVLANGEQLHGQSGLGEGPWVNLLTGSEGTLAVVTAATLRLRPVPERQRFASYQFTSVEMGLAALREVLRAGLRPAVVRLYNPLDTLMASGGDGDGEKPTEGAEKGRVAALEKRLGFKALGVGLRVSWLLNRAVDLVARKGCRLVLVFEGSAAVCEVEARETDELLRKRGARFLGPGPAEHWWAHRYDISFRQAPLFAAGLWVDTLELSARWDKLYALYRSVRHALSPYALCMAHFSHAYPEGCSVYVTFAGGGANAEEGAARHRDAWSAALAAALAEGVSVSHHHGVGLSKAEAYQRQLGDAGGRLLAALKGSLDPAGILNPGKLGLAKPIPRLELVTTPSGRKRRPFRPGSMVELIGELEEQSKLGRTGSLDGLDRSALDAIGPVGEDSDLVEVAAGRRLGGLESRLRSHGLTLGPLAPSVLGGSVASWVEGPHRGLRATPGGFLESGAFSLEAVLADGSLFRTPAVPRSAAGPGLESLVAGGEGRLALLTSAVLRLTPAPKGRRRVVLRAKATEPLLEALRRGLDGDAVPTAAGLYREGKDVVLAVAYDASEALSQAHAELLTGLAKRLSLQRGKAVEANHWWSGRAEAAGHEAAVAWADLPTLFQRWTGRLRALPDHPRGLRRRRRGTAGAGEGTLASPLPEAEAPADGRPTRAGAGEAPRRARQRRLGMNSLRVLADKRSELDQCAYCPKLCRFNCPVSEVTGREGFTPWGKMSTAFLVEKRSRPPDAALAEAAFACSGCGRCQSFCRNHVGVADTLAAARAVANGAGHAPPGIQALLQRFRRDGSPVGALDAILAGSGAEVAPPSQTEVFFPGCTALALEPTDVLAAQAVGAALSSRLPLTRASTVAAAIRSTRPATARASRPRRAVSRRASRSPASSWWAIGLRPHTAQPLPDRRRDPQLRMVPLAEHLAHSLPTLGARKPLRDRVTFHESLPPGPFPRLHGAPAVFAASRRCGVGRIRPQRRRDRLLRRRRRDALVDGQGRWGDGASASARTRRGRAPRGDRLPDLEAGVAARRGPGA